MLQEIVAIIATPLIIPVTGFLKKYLPKKVIPTIPIIVGILANLIASQFSDATLTKTLVYGVSSGGIGSSIYDQIKAIIKR